MSQKTSEGSEPIKIMLDFDVVGITKVLGFDIHELTKVLGFDQRWF